MLVQTLEGETISEIDDAVIVPRLRFCRFLSEERKEVKYAMRCDPKTLTKTPFLIADFELRYFVECNDVLDRD
jgi:hypothetical protein